MRIAVYPGSFDPITNGHLDVLRRSLKVFDQVIVLVANNVNKKTYFSVDDRVSMIKEAVKKIENVSVDYTEGLSIEYAKNKGAVALIRGLRAVSDFEYEFQMAAANRFITPEIEEVFFMSDSKNEFISSSTVKELFKSGVDISGLVPESVVKYFNK